MSRLGRGNAFFPGQNPSEVDAFARDDGGIGPKNGGGNDSWEAKRSKASGGAGAAEKLAAGNPRFAVKFHNVLFVPEAVQITPLGRSIQTANKRQLP